MTIKAQPAAVSRPAVTLSRRMMASTPITTTSTMKAFLKTVRRLRLTS